MLREFLIHTGDRLGRFTVAVNTLMYSGGASGSLACGSSCIYLVQYARLIARHATNSILDSGACQNFMGNGWMQSDKVLQNTIGTLKELESRCGVTARQGDAMADRIEEIQHRVGIIQQAMLPPGFGGTDVTDGDILE